MTDRELLEAAAKTIGLRVVDRSAPVSLYVEHEGCKGGVFWNPLSDDGDAFRLAVKLNIQITPGTYNKNEFTAFRSAGGEAHQFWSSMQDDYAATRRAIVRAAAAIRSGGREG